MRNLLPLRRHIAPSIVATRLRRLPTTEVGGLEVPIAVGARARLLGLAFLDRDLAGTGLLIPRCKSVHTFGMRFGLDLVFLDADLCPLLVVLDAGPRRIVSHRAASAVLETPAVGGEPLRGRP